MHIIIGMPLHIIMHGIPICIICIIISQRCFIISICEASIGIILHIMPSLVISTVMRHIMGIIICMPIPIIMGFIIPIIIGFIIPGIIPPIIGMGIGIGIAAFIIGSSPALVVGAILDGRIERATTLPR